MNITFIELLPLLSAFLVLFLGAVVFSQGKRTLLDSTFSLFALCVTVWLFGTFMMFFNKEDIFVALFWDKFVYVGVVFIPAVMYHFGLALIRSRNIKKNVVLFSGYIISTVFLFLIPADLFIDDVFIYQWGVHAKAQVLHNAFLVYFVTYLTLWFVLVGSYYRVKAGSEERRKIRLVFIGFFILAIVGSLGFLPAYGIGIYPFSYISGVIFTVILAYTILKYRLFNIRIITTEFLVFALISALLSEVLFSETVTQLMLGATFLVLITIFSFLLIRGIYKEISEREKAEILAKELEDANDRLRMLEKQKTEFVSIASHQLRTPLTAIKGYASMLLEGSFGKLSDGVKDAIEKIFKSSQILVVIIEDFLMVSRIEQGLMRYDLDTVDLRHLVEEVVSEKNTDAKEKGLIMSVEVEDGGDYKTRADYAKMKQVVHNVVNNAIKYTEKGFIRVLVSKDAKNKKIRIAISDTGIGMDKKTISILFQKFSKLGEKKHFGSGLGLYVAREIVKAHSGRIWAESKSGLDGSTFFIEIPQLRN